MIYYLKVIKDIKSYANASKITNSTCSKASNTFKILLNKICQITNSFCQEKEATEKVHNNIMNSINS